MIAVLCYAMSDLLEESGLLNGCSMTAPTERQVAGTPDGEYVDVLPKVPLMPDAPADGRWEPQHVRAWLRSGEIPGCEVESGTDRESCDGLSHAELKALESKGLELDDAAARLERLLRATELQLEALAKEASSESWDAAMRRARRVTGEDDSAPRKGAIGRAFRKLRTLRSELRDKLSRLRTELRESGYDWQPYTVVPALAPLERLDPLRCRNHVATWEQVSEPAESCGWQANPWVPEADYGTAESDQGLQVGLRGDIADEQPPYSAGDRSDRALPGDRKSDGSRHRHFGFFASIRKGRIAAVREWMRNNPKRARTLLETVRGSAVLSQDGRVFRMTGIELKAHRERQVVLHEAFAKRLAPNWAETTVPPFRDIVALKREARELANRKPPRRKAKRSERATAREADIDRAIAVLDQPGDRL